jgi:hypothetical protein
MDDLAYYRKAFLAALAVVASTFLVVAQDDLITAIEIVNLVLAGLGAFVLYVTPEAPGHAVTKAIILALTAALQFVASAIEAGDFDLDATVWGQIIATAVAAVLAAVIPQPSLPPPSNAGAPPTA